LYNAFWSGALKLSNYRNRKFADKPIRGQSSCIQVNSYNFGADNNAVNVIWVAYTIRTLYKYIV